ncbi:DUF3078 domain-containing protein [Stygiobacter electus]|jgi:hypothetical protein|uniref:DUF3078 domain-containing protein n=1 Tax=Stygiobacter electus TaxID=3032292 RepID=A0AAE3TDX4_9BACT|nr:DUF3078 domain-containing protein [Stygiobacter electus]MDF1611658.1 DUF3078 domain-containing protein [Stygiobacter electus]
MKKIFFILVLIFTFNTFALVQDSLKNKWIPSLVTNIGFNQVAFSNWVKGGENSIAWSILANFSYNNTSDLWTYKNSLKGLFGRSKIGSGNYITTDNDLYIENLVSYNVGWAVSPYLSNSIRTQITKGYDYKSSPTKQISDLFDPGYITQTLGFTFDKYPNIITRLGIGLQEVFTNKFIQYTDNATTTDVEKFKFETGIESVTDFDFKIDDNIIYKSKLRLFSQFKSLDIWDVRFDNIIAAKISKLISVNFNFLAIYEKAQSPKTQIKEGLQVGFVFNIL